MERSLTCRLSFLGANSHVLHLQLVEEHQYTIDMKHDLRPVIIVEDHRIQAQGWGGMIVQMEGDIARLHRLGDPLHLEDMETAQAQGIVIYALTGHVRTLDQGPDPAHFLRGRGLVPHRDALKATDDETVPHHHEEEGKEGVPATRAFRATAREVGVEVGVDIDAGDNF